MLGCGRRIGSEPYAAHSVLIITIIGRLFFPFIPPAGGANETARLVYALHAARSTTKCGTATAAVLYDSLRPSSANCTYTLRRLYTCTATTCMRYTDDLYEICAGAVVAVTAAAATATIVVGQRLVGW